MSSFILSYMVYMTEACLYTLTCFSFLAGYNNLHLFAVPKTDVTGEHSGTDQHYCIFNFLVLLSLFNIVTRKFWH